ncbi:MAG: maltotransferase domain-containing protein [Gammaproteobacteria bacterium]
MKKEKMLGPCIFHLDVRRAGPVAAWGKWLERAQALGCDWLWLAGIQSRGAGVHPLAVDEPCRLASWVEPAEWESFVAAARHAGLRLAADFAPAFVARTSALLDEHPDWFVAGPDGTPAVPDGLGGADPAATLAVCDFAGGARDALEQYWGDAAGKLLACGFDALVCRAAQRLHAENWIALLKIARRERSGAVFCAETLGAPIAVSEALAPAGFDAFLSSACWWDFHADWFLEQETRLRRMAPTIAFAEPPDGSTTGDGVPFRYGFAATATWGMVIPGSRVPGSGSREKIATINAMKRATPALNGPSRLRRLNAPGARAVALAVEPSTGEAMPVLMLFNPDPALAVEVACGPLFAALDARQAQARELTPGRSPARLGATSRLALEPLGMRWFELVSPKIKAMRRPLKPPAHVRSPIAIENVVPRIAAGDYPVKRVLGESVEVFADVIAEGHSRPAAALRYRAAGETSWREARFEFFDNDHWRGEFAPDRIGRWEFQLIAWRDRYATWREETIRRRDADQTLGPELGEAEAMLEEALGSVAKDERKRLAEIETLLERHGGDVAARAELLLAETTARRIEAALPRSGLSTSQVFPVLVERPRARTGAWYECFPRSLGAPGKHGTFDDLIGHLPYIAGLGFDVVYLPPIHPIGVAHRKGRNNALTAGPDDPGSPWAIGSKAGGHTAVHPELGTLADFRRLLVAARHEGLEVALDFAIQCSRDHPWIGEHPEWFRWRPDGSIRYAENPPKKYQDIVGVDFHCAEREALWQALAEIVLFWCGEGVRIFRVDNPHTKPLPFWEWLLGEVRARYPDTVFLAEAFTRPKLMYRLAKLGFSQSYTYFTWRETKAELTTYMGDLTHAPTAQFFRPNFWVNTPDINPFHLHDGARAGFVIRAVLAATLAPSWGMYSGYELCEHRPLLNEDGSEREEYLDAEKYELKRRNFDAPGNVRSEVAALNRIRRNNPALSELVNLHFHVAQNDQVIFYSRQAPDDLLWIIVSLDAHAPREADIELPLEMLGDGEETAIAVEDLLAGEHWEWCGRRQHVWLSPARPALILRVGLRP